jgi:DNA repair exonuclease SbcCD ATPase subunit
MADEEKIQKQMEFIIEQQAQFTVDIQQLREGIQQLHEVQANTENLLGRLAAATTAGFKELTEKVSSVIDAQIKTEENVSSLAQRMTELAESQAHTDQRLNVIIDIIREGRNGQTQN